MKKEHLIEINSALCIGCEQCVHDCPANNITIKNHKAVIKDQACIKCAHCEAICPKAAVTITGFDEAPIELGEQPKVDPDELLMAIKARRTIRKFKNTKVPDAVIQQIIEAGRFSPTAKNAQDVTYVVLADEKMKYEAVAVQFFKKIKPIVGVFMKSAKEVEIDDNFFFKQAPLVILVVTKDEVSGSLAASNMALMAEANGLGVLYSGFFTVVANHSKKLRKLLNFKNKEHVVTTLVIGYPNVKYRRTAQKETATVTYL